jgi:hypothetical protein
MPVDSSAESLLFFLPHAFQVRAQVIMQAPTKANLPRLDSFMMHSFAYENLDKQITNFRKLQYSTRDVGFSQK